MRLSKANIGGLPSPLQRAEMKSILAGSWPPLKPLPVFKYETVEYRATIDFDKRRGEWVCRKTSLPSNKIQELRGGLREITMALPHGEAEIFTEDGEPQEHELEKDANRRLRAIQEWRETYESGALYSELRGCLSESQRTEIDDSLRLSLTARQLQFNAKNIAYVFDALSTAGGRFATLIEFAKRNKEKKKTASEATGEEVVPEAKRAADQDEQSPGSSSESRSDVDELPAVSIANVLPEQDQDSLPERKATRAFSQEFEIEATEIVDADSALLIDHTYQEERHSPAFMGIDAEVRKDQPSADAIEGPPSRFRALEISGFQVAVFAALFLSAVFAFAVGLTVGRGPLGSRLREAPKSLLAADAKAPAAPAQAEEATSRTPTPPVASSNGSAVTHTLPDATRYAEKSKDSESSPTIESKPSAEPEINSERSAASGLIAPKSAASQRMAPKMGTAPHLPGSSTILVSLPGQGSQPFRVSFPEKAVAATSSFAMTSQLSVVVSAEPGDTAGHKAARLEAGELASFIWPRYPRPRSGLAETIRVRATIGQLGQVQEVKFLGGSVSLLPATTRAIRQWRYSPTLLDKRPVQAQQDVTIEFRPPQYSSRVSSHRRSHN